MAGRPLADLFVNVRPDTSGFDRELQRSLRNKSVKVKVEVDRRSLDSANKGLDRSFANLGKSINKRLDLSGAGKDFSSLTSSVLSLKGAALLAAPVVAALGGSAVAAATSLAAIGPAALAAASAVGVVKLATGDAIDAFKAYQKADELAKRTSIRNEVTTRKLKNGKIKTTTKQVKTVNKDPFLFLNQSQKNFANQLVDTADKVDLVKKGLSNALLPSLTKSLKLLGTKPKNGTSFLDFLGKEGDRYAKSIGKTTENIAKTLNGKESRGFLDTIGKNGTSALTNLGHAANTALTPILKIFANSAPLIVRFSKYVDDGATKFAKFIGKFSNNDLKGYFDRAGGSLSKLVKPVTDIGSAFINVFGSTSAQKSGDTLLDKLGGLTQKLKDFTSSDKGQAKIKSFFDAVKGFDFKNAASLAGSVGTIAASVGALSKIKDLSPTTKILGAFAVAFPQESADAAKAIAEGITPLVKFLADHPELATFFTALVGVKQLTGFKLGNVFKDAFTGGIQKVFVTNPASLGLGGAGAGAAGAAGAAGRVGLASVAIGVLGDAAVLAAAGVAAYGITTLVLKKTGLYDKLADLGYNAGGGNDKSRPFDEKNTFDDLEKAGKNAKGGFLGNLLGGALGDSDFILKNTQVLQDYINMRKKNVAQHTEEIRASQGDAAAEKYTKEQRLLSIQTLEIEGEKFGLSKQRAHAYAVEIYGVPVKLETKVNTPGLDLANTNFKNLKSNIDPVTGKKQITVDVNGQSKVFATLKELATYQRALQQGDTSAAGLDRAKKAIQRDTDATNSGNYGHAATGKKIVGPGTGTSDDIPIMASNGEWVIKERSSKQYGDRFMSAVNNGTFPNYLANAFANGGEVGDTSRGKNIYFPFPVNAAGTKIPNIDTSGGGAGGTIGGGKLGSGGWRAQVAALAKAGYIFHPSNGQTTGGGHAKGSYHYQGRAVDLSPPTAGAYKYILSHFGGSSKELIYAPFADSNIKNGKTHRYSSSILKAHYNHIHWAYADGGKVTKGSLQKKTVQQLHAIAKAKGMHGYSKLNKAKLISAILSFKPPKTHKISNSLNTEAGYQQGLTNAASAKDSKHARAVKALYTDAKSGGISAGNLKLLRTLSGAELTDMASTILTQGQAQKIYTKLTSAQKPEFAAAFGQRLSTNKTNAKNAGIFKKFAASTKATYSANATKLYNSLVRSGVDPSEAAAAASDLLSKGDDAISAKQNALGLDSRYDIKAPGAIGGDVKIAADSIGQIVGGILARPAEVYVNRTKLAQTQDRDFARYLNTGVA